MAHFCAAVAHFCATCADETTVNNRNQPMFNRTKEGTQKKEGGGTPQKKSLWKMCQQKKL
jgi:hypothetical protein